MKNDEAFECRAFKVIKPESNFKFYWELFMTPVLVVLGIIVPIDAAFINNNSDFSVYIVYFCTVVFSVDIIITINSGIYVKGKACTERIVILKQYLKFWFWIDFISAVPIDLLLENILNRDQIESKVVIGENFNILRALKLVKIVRITRLKSLIHSIEDRMTKKRAIVFIHLIKVFIYLIMVANYIACFMFIVSSQNPCPNSFAVVVENSIGSNEYNWFEMYITCLYWGFTTMISIGYGDFTPRNTNERIFSIFCMNVSSIIFGYLLGNVGLVLSKHTAKDQERRDLMVALNQYMKNYNLPENMVIKIRKYTNYLYSRPSTNKTKDILQVVSLPLKEEIFNYMNQNILLKLQIFKNCSKITISHISKLLEPQINSPNDLIFTESDESNSAFFITKGCAEIFDIQSGSTIKVLSINEYFGEIGLFTKRARCASIIAVSFLETLDLQREAMENLGKQFPEISNMMNRMLELEENKSLAELGVICYLCKEIGHIGKYCSKFNDIEGHKQKWLESKKHSNLIENGQKWNSKDLRQKKVMKNSKLGISNIWGRKQDVNNLYKGEASVRKASTHYLNKKGTNKFLLPSSRSSIFDSEDDNLCLIKKENQLKIIFESESDESIEEIIERDKTFDRTLIELDGKY